MPARQCRFTLMMLVGVVLLAASLLVAIRIGSTETPMTFRDVLTIVGHEILPDGWMDSSHIPQGSRDIIWLLRTPRALVAAMVGAMLALAGVQLQGLFRNPLAAPGIIGISQGAALGAAIAIASGLALRSLIYTPLFSFLGALLALMIILIVSLRGGGGMATLLLVGVALNFLLGAGMSLIISLALKHRWDVAQQILTWTMGGISQSSWRQVAIAAPCLLIGLAATLYLARDLDLMLEGEDSARSLGVNTQRTVQLSLLATALLTGGAVAVGGVIGFVGLVVPHMVRLILGPGHRRLAPAAALTGAWFLILADLLARTVIRPEEIHLGILTAILGAPLFLFLLYQQRKEAAWL
ncbi:MAG: iron ABC transporter permease [Phycisphaeraceae bacterium]|nr:iron ABC transporter permease [Phycisphaeraceae bacterium]